jgi:antitoxin MazE9
VIDVYVAVVISKLARVLHRVVRPLRASSLGDADVLAWHEWEQSGEAELWESTAADGVPNY